EELVLKNAILCSEAFIENPDEQPENWQIRGMSTERALVLAGGQRGLFKNQLEELEPQIDEIPFDSKYKYSASLRKISRMDKQENHSISSKFGEIIYVKGAPEIILEKSKYLRLKDQQVEMDEAKRALLNQEYEKLTNNGYRVLATAYKIDTNLQSTNGNLEEEICDLVFVGFIFLEDPIRQEAKQAIQTCYQAGMRPIIVTGDHRLTAKAIANQLGFNVKDENILEGKDLEKMSDEEFDQKINSVQIFARLEPKHKLRIIEALQKKGKVVAMTGDGINDAPALKQADIGVALGSGTQVAKEVSDLVLLTDDFSIIVSAVEEGRAILDNIRKVITYLLSDSFTEVILISTSMIAGLPLPVTAVQILWINLIEDGLPDIALAFEPKEKDLMKQKPQSRDVPLLTQEMKIIIFIVGLFTDLMLLGLFFWLWKQNHNIDYVRTMVFACLAIDSISYVFCCKSLKKNLWHTNLFDNKLLLAAWFVGIISLLSAIYIPILNRFLGTIPLPFSSWYIIVGLAIINVVLIEVVKHYFIVRHQTEV
ncbi:MAG TPA: HAD-IC family P-type ATPase, partial [Candidatus Woesebacteria bacterium]|nr:HAD-IC family P-type ATPase [Candidatus Woesebacteria bacterium]